MKAYLTLACFLWMMGTDMAHSQSTTAMGVFSDDQAKRGQLAYNANCAGCHGADLHSTDREVPDLTDAVFKSHWVGKTILEKFEEARDTMPPREERSLKEEMYLDIVTYILRANNAPAGPKELKLDTETLKQIKISDPAK